MFGAKPVLNNEIAHEQSVANNLEKPLVGNTPTSPHYDPVIDL